MTPPLISSQRYFNKEIVARKVANFKVFVVRTIDLELRGKVYRVLIDGHHNLLAAGVRGVEPTWKGAPAKFQRIMRSMAPQDFAAFMINNLTDSDYYFVETGEVVQELLGAEG
jgi:hypothetical protein